MGTGYPAGMAWLLPRRVPHHHRQGECVAVALVQSVLRVTEKKPIIFLEGGTRHLKVMSWWPQETLKCSTPSCRNPATNILPSWPV